MDIFFPCGVLTVSPGFKPGDQPPKGYNDWHEWAEVQHKAGLRQSRCTNCCKWRFPQEVCCGGERISAKEFDRINRQVSQQEDRIRKAKMRLESRMRKEIYGLPEDESLSQESGRKEPT